MWIFLLISDPVLFLFVFVLLVFDLVAVNFFKRYAVIL